MSIRCFCIDAKNKPKEIPENKWVKEGNEYHVYFIITVLPQKQLGFILEEIELDESCTPYEFFLSHRFMFNPEDLDRLMQLIKDCTDTKFSVDEVIKQTQLETV